MFSFQLFDFWSFKPLTRGVRNAKIISFFYFIGFQSGLTWKTSSYVIFSLVFCVCPLISPDFLSTSYYIQRAMQRSLQEMVKIGQFSLLCRDYFRWHHKPLCVFFWLYYFRHSFSYFIHFPP